MVLTLGSFMLSFILRHPLCLNFFQKKLRNHFYKINYIYWFIIACFIFVVIISKPTTTTTTTTQPTKEGCELFPSCFIARSYTCKFNYCNSICLLISRFHSLISLLSAIQLLYKISLDNSVWVQLILP